jgi:4-hydroxy-3-polyprenylbenzoate decarboxylase
MSVPPLGEILHIKYSSFYIGQAKWIFWMQNVIMWSLNKVYKDSKDMTATENYQEKSRSRRLVVGISGASGIIYGVRLLHALQDLEIETHLVISKQAVVTLHQETDYTVSGIAALADYTHSPDNLAAPIASGSFTTDGMMVVPCSIKSLSAIANSYAENLLTRSADVTLKEGRPLLLVVRETPLHVGHLLLMTRAAEMGAIIFPPVPGFYHRPETVDDIIEQTVGRMLARIGITDKKHTPWMGPSR